MVPEGSFVDGFPNFDNSELPRVLILHLQDLLLVAYIRINSSKHIHIAVARYGPRGGVGSPTKRYVIFQPPPELFARVALAKAAHALRYHLLGWLRPLRRVLTLD